MILNVSTLKCVLLVNMLNCWVNLETADEAKMINVADNSRGTHSSSPKYAGITFLLPGDLSLKTYQICNLFYPLGML